MLKGFRYRIYPNLEQVILIEKHFGCVRLVRNLAFEAKRMAYSGTKTNVSKCDLTKQIVDLKKELPFLKEVNAESLQATISDLYRAYQNFFEGRARFPKFKKKKNRQSFSCSQTIRVNFVDGKLRLPKFKEMIKCEFHRRFNGKIKNATIIKTPSGKYFASIIVDTKDPIQIKKIIQDDKTCIGIDLNLKDTVVLSDGTKFKNPKNLYLHEKKLKWLQHNFDRMKIGSNRRERMRLRIARIHEKIANSRKDFLHKTSDAITKRFDTICMEDLNVTGMMKNRKLAKAIGDASWGMLKTFITYKTDWRGKNVLLCDRFDATSKTCSCCGLKNESLTLDDRSWICPFCFAGHDRDVNAGINIKQFALKKFWQMERLRHDAEASPLQPAILRDCKGTDEASKVQEEIAPFA